MTVMSENKLNGSTITTNLETPYVEFLRNEARHPVATVVAIPHNDDYVVVGVSRCSPKDRFCKHTGLSIAMDRANKVKEGSPTNWAGMTKRDTFLSVLKTIRWMVKYDPAYILECFCYGLGIPTRTTR
jgi:hypothetical protein